MPPKISSKFYILLSSSLVNIYGKPAIRFHRTIQDKKKLKVIWEILKQQKNKIVVEIIIEPETLAKIKTSGLIEF